MELYRFVKPLGILTFLLIILTAISGKMGWKIKNHVLLAIITIIFAAIHGLIVILSH